MNRVPRGENMGLCLQVTLVHGGAVGTATPKQPKINLLHIHPRTLNRFAAPWYSESEHIAIVAVHAVQQSIIFFSGSD